MFSLGNPFNVTKGKGVFVFTGPAKIRIESEGLEKSHFDKLLQKATQDRGQGEGKKRQEQIRQAFADAAKRYKIE